MGFDLEPTYTVSELTDEIQMVLGEAFRGLWVRGEVHRPRASQRGHLYLELIEKGRADQILGKIDAVIWRTDFQRIRRQLRADDQEIGDGMEIRCFGGLDFYGPGGRLQFVIREVDPIFTLGGLERRRRETLAALQQSGLLEQNRSLPLKPLALRIGLVTSADSAAFHDFMTGLQESGFGFQVVFVHAAMQGPLAEREVPSALEMLGAARLNGSPLDLVVVTRGGGSKTDLAAFDSRAISEAICRCKIPVFCGLGHEIDQSIADLVCRSSFKTPTKVAEHLVDSVADQETYLMDLRRSILDAAENRLRSAWDQMRRAEPLARLAGVRLQNQQMRLHELSERLVRSSRRVLQGFEQRRLELTQSLTHAAETHVQRASRLPEPLARRIAAGAAAQLTQHSTALDGIERWCHSSAPERLLERGFSLTFDARDRLISHPDQVRSGERLTTRLAGGTLVSTATSPDPVSSSDPVASPDPVTSPNPANTLETSPEAPTEKPTEKPQE